MKRDGKYLQITIYCLIVSNLLFVACWMYEMNTPSTKENISQKNLGLFKATDSTFFKIKRKDDGMIDILELYTYQKNRSNASLSQSLSFHKNGSIKKIEVIGFGTSEKKMKDHIEYVYNLNTLTFDDSLNLKSYYLSKDFKVVATNEEENIPKR